MAAANAATATGAQVSIVGHITQDEFRRYLTATEAGNGFGNRFVWYESGAQSACRKGAASRIRI